MRDARARGIAEIRDFASADKIISAAGIGGVAFLSTLGILVTELLQPHGGRNP